jgi:hypothetical protein
MLTLIEWWSVAKAYPLLLVTVAIANWIMGYYIGRARLRKETAHNLNRLVQQAKENK